MLETNKPQSFNAYDRPHADLREFIERAEAAGEILRINGADWDLEMGALAEIVYHAKSEPPAILFEDVPGYPKGMRLLSGATNSSKRLAIALGFPVPRNPLDVVRAYRDRMKLHRLVSILVGVVLSVFGLDPFDIARSIERLIRSVWDMGFDALRWLWRYFLLGAVIVIPTWLVMRIVKASVRNICAVETTLFATPSG